MNIPHHHRTPAPGALLTWAVVYLSTALTVPASQAKPPRFKQDWLRPYLVKGRAGRGREALLAGRSKEAVKLLTAHLRRSRAPARQQARYLLAHALLNEKQVARAGEIFADLMTRYPMLNDYHRFYLATCRYRQKHFKKAADLAGGISAGCALKQDAELLRADALRALKKPREVVAIWSAYLKRHPGGKRVGKAHLFIAEALEQLAARGSGSEKEPLLLRALDNLKQVMIKDPLGSSAAAAEKGLSRLARLLPGGNRRATLTSWERYHQASGYWKAMRHRKAELALADLLKEKNLSKKLLCKARFQRARAVFRQRQRARAAPLYKQAEVACRAAREDDLVVKSLYNGARGLTRRHDFAAAIQQFSQIEKEFGGHSYADDARILSAEAYESMKKEGQVRSTLSSIPTRYPGGDRAREALWRLARLALLDNKYADAEPHLDRIVKELGRTSVYYAQGQALYWKARVAERSRRTSLARRTYERCIRENPLSYYALMAFNRLRERHRSTYNRLRRELILPAGRGAGKWRFSPRALLGRPAFLRGVELARLGFADDAARELSLAGLSIKRGTPKEDLWLAAVLFDRAGLWSRSHYVPRRLDPAFKSTYPLKENFLKWSIAFPRAFAPLVQANSRRSRLPEPLVLAIMREESGFSPTIESWANAVGLMQLLLRTAKKAGNEHRLSVTRRRLKDPAVNIKVGTTYLGFLYRSFGLLGISGYNAGEGAVLRWLRRFPKLPLDLFIERIPFDQTRRYTKRVLSSLFTYSVLHQRGVQRIPRLTQRLPRARLAPFGKYAPKRKRKRKRKTRPRRARSKK